MLVKVATSGSIQCTHQLHNLVFTIKWSLVNVNITLELREYNVSIHIVIFRD